jgi:hypothetical protein
MREQTCCCWATSAAAGRPSWPISLLPQVNMKPLLVSAALCESPAQASKQKETWWARTKPRRSPRVVSDSIASAYHIGRLRHKQERERRLSLNCCHFSWVFSLAGTLLLLPYMPLVGQLTCDELQHRHGPKRVDCRRRPAIHSVAQTQLARAVAAPCKDLGGGRDTQCVESAAHDLGHHLLVQHLQQKERAPTTSFSGLASSYASIVLHSTIRLVSITTEDPP